MDNATGKGNIVESARNGIQSKMRLQQHQSRIEWIDYFRCFGILLMVMGHIGFGGKFDIWIHGFHMPMFFFISGVLYAPVAEKADFSSSNKPQYIRDYVLKKARKILPPYLCVGMLSYVLWIIKNATQCDNFLSPLFHLLWDNSEGLPCTGALWFLTAFFSRQLFTFSSMLPLLL